MVNKVRTRRRRASKWTKYLSFNTHILMGFLSFIQRRSAGSRARASGENLINDHRCKAYAQERSIGIRCQLAAHVANRIITMTIVRRREKGELIFVLCDYDPIFLYSAKIDNALSTIIKFTAFSRKICSFATVRFFNTIVILPLFFIGLKCITNHLRENVTTVVKLLFS